MTIQIGILLALLCAFTTNVGFLLKHRGACAAPAVDFRRPLRSAIGLWKSRWFAIGMLVAAGAFVLHVAALALAPLSLVQAVISGGLVFLTVLADRVFGFDVGARQWAGVGLTALGDPVARASQAWAEFRTGGDPSEQPSGSVRFTSVAGQNRYDFWRVAVSQLQDRPLLGAGADNFQDDYLAGGNSPEQPRYPHSFELRVLGQTGLAGGLLFGGALAVALGVGIRTAFRGSGLAGAAAGTAVATFLYWAIHGSVDWFFELPALGASAFAMLGLACALAPRRTILEPRRPRSNALVGGAVGATALAVLTAAAGAVLALPWLAERDVQRAIEVWPARPDEAFHRLRRAADLNPLSTAPHTTAAAIALRLDRPRTARSELEAAIDLHPRSAYSTLQLAALASEQRRRMEALDLLARASALAPRDGLIDDARATVRDGGRLDALETYDAVLARRAALTGS